MTFKLRKFKETAKEEKYHDENEIADKLTILLKPSSTFSKAKLVHKSNDAYLLITFKVKVDALDAHDLEFLNKTLKHLPAMYYQIISSATGEFKINFVGYP